MNSWTQCCRQTKKPAQTRTGCARLPTPPRSAGQMRPGPHDTPYSAGRPKILSSLRKEGPLLPYDVQQQAGSQPYGHGHHHNNHQRHSHAILSGAPLSRDTRPGNSLLHVHLTKHVSIVAESSGAVQSTNDRQPGHVRLYGRPEHGQLPPEPGEKRDADQGYQEHRHRPASKGARRASPAMSWIRAPSPPRSSTATTRKAPSAPTPYAAKYSRAPSLPAAFPAASPITA